MSPQSYYTLSNIFIAVGASLGGIGAIIGALGGFGRWHFGQQIETTPPEIEVKSVIPVMLYERGELPFGPDKKVPFMEKGLSFVLHLKSSSKPVTISRLRIKGKIFVSPNFYLSLDEHVGRDIQEIGKEWEKRKPYVNVDWIAYVDEKKSDKRLDAFDDRLICFNLIDVIMSGQAESGWEVPRSDYVGYSDGTKEPAKTRSYPEFDFFFTTKLGGEFPSDMRDEIKRGDIQFILLAGSKEIVIPYGLFKRQQWFGRKYWDENPIEKLVFRDK